jgi:small subunit ribosomal protein S18
MVRERRKVCKFCRGDAPIDYKDEGTLRRLVAEHGKIVPRRVSGVCARHQRQVATAVKRARYLAILPYVGKRYR